MIDGVAEQSRSSLVPLSEVTEPVRLCVENWTFKSILPEVTCDACHTQAALINNYNLTTSTCPARCSHKSPKSARPIETFFLCVACPAGVRLMCVALFWWKEVSRGKERKKDFHSRIKCTFRSCFVVLLKLSLSITACCSIVQHVSPASLLSAADMAGGEKRDSKAINLESIHQSITKKKAIL